MNRKLCCLILVIFWLLGGCSVANGESEQERFLDIPILSDGEIEEEYPGEELIHLSERSHDEILEFYTSTLEAEGWTLKNRGTEIHDDYSVTLRLFERGETQVRLAISEQADGTRIFLIRQ